MTEETTVSEQWFVVDHDRDDLKLHGPYVLSETAAAVRREMERLPPYDEDGNLWIVSETLDGREQHEPGKTE